MTESSKGTSPVKYVFVFLELFEREGGIQSYVKDILQAYQSLASQTGSTAEVFLLRDSPECDNPFEAYPFKFHYLKTKNQMLGRLKMVIELGLCLLQQHPSQVFCGHIKLAVLIMVLCKIRSIPYTVLTYGKEVWSPLPKLEQQALTSAAGIWTISRYSRDRLCATNNLDPKKVQDVTLCGRWASFHPWS